jgi:hypothetical protein
MQIRCKCGQALHEFLRRHHDGGDNVAAGALHLQHELVGEIALDPFVGNGS